MDELIRQTVNDRRPYFELGANATGYPEVVVEKDFWVCVVLRELFALPDVGAHLTFKGGTSLSKAYGLIERFSEDVDLVIDRGHLGYEGELSQNRIKKLKKAVRAKVHEQILPGLSKRLHAIISGDGSWRLEPATKEEDRDQQTLLFHYPRVGFGAAGAIREVVKIELGARSDTEPHEVKNVRAFVGDLDNFKADDSFDVAVRVVHPRRTLWEKVCAIHEVNTGIGAPNRAMSRHLYDVVELLRAGFGSGSESDVALLKDVIRHRRWAFARKGVDYDAMERGEFALAPDGSHTDEWRRDYATMEVMIANEPPDFKHLIAELGRLEGRLRQNFRTDGK
jgi:predicted nucleotidyltransferase component of viral defense system